MVMKFNQFINEALGILDSIESLYEKIKKNLSKKKYYRLKTEYLGKKITIHCFFGDPGSDASQQMLASFKTLDPKRYEFEIKTNDLSKPVIIHELKHMDRIIRRGLKVDKSFNISHIGRYIAKNYPHLFTDKNNMETLIETFYYCNPDEFESHFNDMYQQLKEETSGMDKIEIRNYITEFLEEQEIYIFYKHFNKDKFNIEDFFKSKRDCNFFLREYKKHIKSFFDDKEEGITKLDTFFSWITSSMSVPEENVSTKEINKVINKTVRNNYPKFGRLYTLLLQ